jgi:hypothetical protein
MDNMELLKDKVRNIDEQYFVSQWFRELQVGDIVSSSTMTYSQKYFDREGYEQYNMKKYGILLTKNEEYPQDSILLQYDSDSDSFVETNLYADPGTSGIVELQKYME